MRLTIDVKCRGRPVWRPGTAHRPFPTNHINDHLKLQNFLCKALAGGVIVHAQQVGDSGCDISKGLAGAEINRLYALAQNQQGHIFSGMIRGGCISRVTAVVGSDQHQVILVQVLQETGAEKVNIIAHSKGGLDSRYCISMLGMAPYVASLTTVNTPHRGCEFADYLMNKAPDNLRETVAAAYNKGAKVLGDHNPDFVAAVTDLTSSGVQKLNDEMAPMVHQFDGIYTQSFGSKLNHATSGKFPLNMSYHFVKHFDGYNDGLVGENSFQWGSE